MVTLEVYVDTWLDCDIKHVLNGVIKYNRDNKVIVPVSLKKKWKYQHKISVPIQVVRHFGKKKMATVNLYRIQELVGG